MYCKNCGIEIEEDITNPLSLCDDCEEELNNEEDE